MALNHPTSTPRLAKSRKARARLKGRRGCLSRSAAVALLVAVAVVAALT